MTSLIRTLLGTAVTFLILSLGKYLYLNLPDLLLIYTALVFGLLYSYILLIMEP